MDHTLRSPAHEPLENGVNAIEDETPLFRIDDCEQGTFAIVLPQEVCEVNREKGQDSWLATNAPEPGIHHYGDTKITIDKDEVVETKYSLYHGCSSSETFIQKASEAYNEALPASPGSQQHGDFQRFVAGLARFLQSNTGEGAEGQGDSERKKTGQITVGLPSPQAPHSTCGDVSELCNSWGPEATFQGETKCLPSRDPTNDNDLSATREALREGRHRESIKRKIVHVDRHRKGKDGYTWQKYGHKLLSGTNSKRFYYSCTEKESLGCTARKVVDRDPDAKPGDYSSDSACIKGQHNHPPPTFTLKCAEAVLDRATSCSQDISTEDGSDGRSTMSVNSSANSVPGMTVSRSSDCRDNWFHAEDIDTLCEVTLELLSRKVPS